ncbi:MAG: SDR family NAD(P)-dependent oxidoreductase [Planctomycetota bacterium]
MAKNGSPKLIVITGVTRGLGRALTQGFIAQGHTVLGCARSRDAVQKLSHSFGKPNEFQNVDVTREDQVETWASRVLAHHRAPDILINNAAIINRNAKLWDVSAKEFDQIMDVNVKGVANVLRHFVPAMIARGKGVIVNFSSGWGRSVSAEVAPYCASKYAIEGLTLALAEELPSGLTAVPLNPGVIDTDMLRSCFGADAGTYPAPDQWAKKAVPYILGIGQKVNGMSLTVE